MDRRVAILTRLQELLGSITGAPANAVYRNRGLTKADKRPCMILLDGAETVHQNFERRPGRLYARNAPSVMMLEPQIFALLLTREIAKADEYAPELASYRNAIIWSILNDSELMTITGESGDIAYRGVVTDMQTGRPMQGEMQFFFRFYYVLDPQTDLV